MILSGTHQKLTVGRISDYGLYLTDGEGNEVLLPNRYVSLEDTVGKEMDVFVYHDSEDRLVASTEEPLITVGHTAFLEVIDKTVHGAFLDWGLTAKDLFLPNRNMIGRVDAGNKYVVYAYRDNITGRTVATMQLKSFIGNEGNDLKRGDEVDVMVALKTESGFRVVIDDRFWGMVYNNQVFTPLAIGDRVKGYVRQIAEDGRIDISLQKEGYDVVMDSSEKLLSLMRENGGSLPLNDASSPDEVASVTGMSKKVFKRTVGYLMKRGELEMGENEIRSTATVKYLEKHSAPTQHTQKATRPPKKLPKKTPRQEMVEAERPAQKRSIKTEQTKTSPDVTPEPRARRSPKKPAGPAAEFMKTRKPRSSD